MRWSFAQITDHHLGTHAHDLLQGYATGYALEAVLSHLADHAAEVDFVVATGDLVNTPTPESYAYLCALYGINDAAHATPLHLDRPGFRKPLYVLPGNHDDRELFFRYLLPQTQPAPRFHTWFHHGGITCVMLDWGPDGKAVADESLWTTLAAACATGEPLIIFTHHHLVPVGSAWLDAFLPDDERFWEALDGHQVLGIFSGHAHISYEAEKQGIPVFGLRSTAPAIVPQDTPLLCLLPPQYRVATVEDGILTTKLIDVPL